MNKGGLSQVIVNVLLIVLVIVVISTLWAFLNNYLKKSPIEESQSRLNCLKDVDIEVLNACYDKNPLLNNPLLKITVKNKRELTLGDFFLIRVTYNNDTMVDIPTAYYTYIQGYETKTIIIPFYPNIKKIKVIPKIEGQVYLCTNEAPEVENIKDCEINVGGS